MLVSGRLAAQHCHVAPSHSCSQGRQQPNVLILSGSLAAAVKIGEGLSTELGAMSYNVPNPILVPIPLPVFIHVSFPISIPIPVSGGCRLSLLPPWVLSTQLCRTTGGPSVCRLPALHGHLGKQGQDMVVRLPAGREDVALPKDGCGSVDAEDREILSSTLG